MTAETRTERRQDGGMKGSDSVKTNTESECDMEAGLWRAAALTARKHVL